MKKLLLILLLILPINVMSLSAESYVVMDAESLRVLEGNNYNKKMLIASTTKIMTSIVAIENMNIDTYLTVSDNVLKSYGSGIYIKPGEILSLKDLLYGLMLRSGNDAAIEIAYLYKNNIDDFVKLMNDYTVKLNMNNSTFINPSGLENNRGIGNISTSHDMALLMSYAINNEIFKDIIATKKYELQTNMNYYVWNNKNKLLNSYEYCIGGKTGYTEKARRTLVTGAIKDDKKLVIVTLNDPLDFSNHKRLYEKVFNIYERIKVLDKRLLKKENIIIKDDFYMLIKEEEKERININYKYFEKESNNKIGVIEISIDDNIINKVDILKKEKRVNNKKNNIFRIIINYIKGLFND